MEREEKWEKRKTKVTGRQASEEYENIKKNVVKKGKKDEKKKWGKKRRRRRR